MTKMKVSHWLFPVEVLGPNARLALWVQGCRKHCAGCVSPELRAQNGGIDYQVPELAKLLNRILREHRLQGVTISGGEPFEQAEELFALCESLQCADILVYSGYSYRTLCRRYGAKLKKSGIGVLVTGPYRQELNDDLPLRGSANQQIVYLKDELRESYRAYLAEEKRRQQMFVAEDQIFLAGIPPAGRAEVQRAEIEKIIAKEAVS